MYIQVKIWKKKSVSKQKYEKLNVYERKKYNDFNLFINYLKFLIEAKLSRKIYLIKF